MATNCPFWKSTLVCRYVINFDLLLPRVTDSVVLWMVQRKCSVKRTILAFHRWSSSTAWGKKESSSSVSVIASSLLVSFLLVCPLLRSWPVRTTTNLTPCQVCKVLFLSVATQKMLETPVYVRDKILFCPPFPNPQPPFKNHIFSTPSFPSFLKIYIICKCPSVGNWSCF